MNVYKSQVMDKIADLQQQTHFCINNYDYHHNNDEMEILRLKEKQLRVSTKYLEGFLNALRDWQSTIEEAAGKCDEVDELLAKCTAVKQCHNDAEGEEESDSNKENN